MKLRLFLPIYFFLLATISNAQFIEWQNTFGGDSTDRLFSIHPSADGGYICGGESFSSASGDKSENSHGFNDYWVVKLDSTGTIVWENTIGGTGNDYLTVVRATSDNGFVAYGYSDSDISGDKTENSLNNDIWIVKLDSSGNIQWQNTITESNGPIALAMNTTSDKGFICGAVGFGTANNDLTCSITGSSDYWILKLDSLGDIEWQACYGGTNQDLINSIQQTADKGYIAGGNSRSNASGVKTEDCFGMQDYWVVKIDSLGNLEWENTIGGSGDDLLDQVIPTPDGGYVCLGWSGSGISGEKTEAFVGNTDYWIVKLDSSGAIEWQNVIGSSATDIGYSATVTFNNEILIGGYSDGNISGDKTENRVGQFDYWVTKLDSLGHIIWQNTIGGLSNDYLQEIQNTNDGGVVCAGYSNSNVGGDKNENTNGNYDFWILKLKGQSNLITGETYGDMNQNNINEAVEPRIPYVKINTINPNLFTYSNFEGEYILPVPDTGTYVLAPDSIDHYSFVPTTHSAVLNNFYLSDSLNDFGYQPAGTFNDLKIHLTRYSSFSPGFNAYYRITYLNMGTTTITPTVWFYPDTNLIFNYSNPAPSNIYIDSISYLLNPIPPFATQSIIVQVGVPANIQIGTPITSVVRVDPIVTDFTPGNNLSIHQAVVTGSYDPNDIYVNRDSLYTFELTSPDVLDYTIRFQNTGTDTAMYVQINNRIDSDLRVDQLEIIDTSHPCIINYQEYESTMKFIFNNIMLPDSNTNEAESHGFVRYLIKPKTNLSPGNSIPNQASIIFDYNVPVITNIATTVILAPTSINEYTETSLKAYPNPATSTINVDFNSTETANTISIYNVYGQLINEFDLKITNANAGSRTIDVSDLSKGIYYLRLNEKTIKFIKL